MHLLKLGLALVCLLFLQIEATENEDEVNPCPDDSLPCDSGQCVRREEWCDKQKNCEDKSDEAYCKKRSWYSLHGDPNNCKDIHFLCNDGRCVPRFAKCDNYTDCSDGSDENNCVPDTFDNNYDYDNTGTTSHIQTEVTTRETYSETDGLKNLDFSITTTQVPTVTFTQDAPLSSSSVNFYDKRREQESGQIDLKPSTSLPPRSTTSRTETVPERNPNPDIAQIITTSRPLPFTTSSTTRAYEKKRYHDPSPTPIPPRQPASKRFPDTSLNPTVYPPIQYNRQTNTPSHQSTRSYVVGQLPNQHHTQRSIPYDYRTLNQYQTQPPRANENRRTTPYQYPTQPTRPSDTRRDPYQYHNQPTMSYDSGRDQRRYQTQPTIPYDPRRNPNQYHNQPTSFYDSRRDPPQYQTQPTRTYESRIDSYHRSSRPDGSRRPVPEREAQYPYQPTLTPTSRNRYSGEIQRVYRDHVNFYDGYYDQSGQFVVLRSGQHQQSYRNPPPDDARRNRQVPDIPATVPTVFVRHLKAPSRFYFAKNYPTIYGDENSFYVRKGKEWILSIRNSTGGWGKETPRALIALSLINNSFVNGTYENDVMQKYFQVHLGTRLLRGDAEMTSLNRLAMTINALIATCQNPRNFHGTDLTDLIQKQLEHLNQRNHDSRTRTMSVNPAVYLSLCLADRDLTDLQENDLIARLNAYFRQEEYSRDMLSLSISAYSCHLRRQKYKDSDSVLSNATTKLLERMKDDGSFGGVYGTALAAQALLSLNDTKHWNPESTFEFLKEQQKSDGSFGDFLATYLVLPVLSGRSLLHLRNTQCSPPKVDRDLTPSEILAFTGPKHRVRYSLYIGDPKVNGYSIELLVPIGISFFDMMRVAQHENDVFKFTYEERSGQILVYSISNIPNDAEQGLEWHLYAKRSSDLELNKIIPREFIWDIRKFYPSSDQHVIFWYHPSVPLS